MQFFILGGTGFVGRHLIKYLTQAGHSVQALVRDKHKDYSLPSNCNLVPGNPLRSGDWQDTASGSEVIVNLTGKNIMTRWTRQAKKDILETRILSTAKAVEAVSKNGQKPPVLINTSAVGFYPDKTDEILTEEDGPGEGFLAQICKNWEQEALKAEFYKARVALTRFAPVLGPDGGLILNLLPVFSKGLGGRLGNGKQAFPWIHIQDLIRGIEFIALNPNIHGPVNFSAPQIITNSEFTKALAIVLRRPALLPVPAAVLKLALGELGQSLVNGPKVEPAKLKQNGFVFNFPEIEPALRDLLK